MNNESKLIHIPVGSPFWAEPLMENLYILENMIESGEGGDWDGVEEIEEKIKEVIETHDRDVKRLNTQMDSVSKAVFGYSGNPGLIHTTQINAEDIAKLKEEIQNIEQGGEIGGEIKDIIEKVQEDIASITVEIDKIKADQHNAIGSLVQLRKEVNEITEQLEGMSQTVVQIEENASNAIQIVETMKAQVKTNTEDIDTLERRVGVMELNISKNHHIVNTVQEMEVITHKIIGTLCFVRGESQMYIWDGKWQSVSPDHALSNVLWEDIVDAPSSSPSEIDATVMQSHRHNNRSALDTISFAKINEWDSKASTSDVPTKLSDLENDIGVGGNYDDVIKEIKKHIGNLTELTTENKASLVGALNEIHSKIKSVDSIREELDEIKERVVYLEN